VQVSCEGISAKRNAKRNESKSEGLLAYCYLIFIYCLSKTIPSVLWCCDTVNVGGCDGLWLTLQKNFISLSYFILLIVNMYNMNVMMSV